MSATPVLIDSHCHLNAPQFDADRDSVLERATDAGVVRLVDVGTEPREWERSLALADEHAQVFVVLGLHPNSASGWTRALERRLIELLRHPKVVGVGETGLDYFRLGAPPEVQELVFAAHMRIARSLDLPVVIHARDAYREVLRAVEQHGAGTRGVMHSFAGTPDEALRATALGYYISLSGPVTYKSGAPLREVAAAVPSDRLLVETDSPYLPPHPHRGRRNEPAYVSLTMEAVAAARGTSVEETARLTAANAARLFRVRIGREGIAPT